MLRRNCRLVLMTLVLLVGALSLLYQYLYVWNTVSIDTPELGGLPEPSKSYVSVENKQQNLWRNEDGKEVGKYSISARDVKIEQESISEEHATVEQRRKDGKLEEMREDGKRQNILDYCNSLQTSSATWDQEGVLAPGHRLTAVVVVTRHGDRSPMYTLPNYPGPSLPCHIDPTSNATTGSDVLRQFVTSMNHLLRNVSHSSPFRRFGLYPNTANCYGAQLTATGTLQMIRLGQHLRVKYPVLAHEARLSRLNAYVRSTEYPRTFQSAVAVLYGFAVWSPDLLTRATVEVTRNIYFCLESPNVSCACPSAMRTLATGAKNRTLHAEEKKVRAEVAQVFDTIPNRLPWLSGILEVLMAHLCHNQSLPCNTATHQCITSQLVERIWRLGEQKHLNDGADHDVLEASRLLARPLLAEIAKRFIASSFYATRKTSPRLIVYSGHDKTISVLLRALGIRDGQYPVFGSRLIFELHSSSSKHRARYFLRVLYNGRDLTSQLDFCRSRNQDDLSGGLCPLDNFLYAVYFHDTTESSYSKACS